MIFAGNLFIGKLCSTVDVIILGQKPRCVKNLIEALFAQKISISFFFNVKLNARVKQGYRNTDFLPH